MFTDAMSLQDGKKEVFKVFERKTKMNENLKERKSGFKKFITPFFVVFFGLAVSWCVWVTSGIFTVKAETVSVQKSLNGINEDMNKIQKNQEENQKELSKKIQDNRDLTHKSQKEMLEILLDIKKKIDKERGK